MKDGYVVLALVLFTGCGKGPLDYFYKKGSPRVTNSTDPAFYKYINRLPLHTTTPIIFKSKEGNIAGTCTRWKNGYKEIQIDPEYWSDADDSLRLELIAHEIGHCDYDLHHNNAKLEDGCPASVMQDTNFGEPCFTDHFNEYMEEFDEA